MSVKQYDMVRFHWEQRLKMFRRSYIQYVQSLSKSKRTLTAVRRQEIDEVLKGMSTKEWLGSTTKAIASLQGIREALLEDIKEANETMARMDSEDRRLTPTKEHAEESRSVLYGPNTAARLLRNIGPVHLIKTPPKNLSIKQAIREFILGKVTVVPVLPEEGLKTGKDKTDIKNPVSKQKVLIQKQ